MTESMIIFGFYIPAVNFDAAERFTDDVLIYSTRGSFNCVFIGGL